MSRDPNPFAFPFVEYNGNGEPVNTAPGMDLRDWFAGKALMSMLCSPGEITSTTYGKAAELSYKFADAMLAERAKGGER